MITGFNTDIEHDGVVYHVQTEDKGLETPLILSLVYDRGTILASKRTPYDDLIAGGFDERVLTERLQKQHKLICAAVRAGRIEDLKQMTAKAAGLGRENKENKVNKENKETEENKESRPAPASLGASPIPKPTEIISPAENAEVQSPQYLSKRQKIARPSPEHHSVRKRPPAVNFAPAIPPPKDELIWDLPLQIVEEDLLISVKKVIEEPLISADAVEIIPELNGQSRTEPKNLAIEFLSETTFRAGERKTLNIRVFRGISENFMAAAQVMVKVLGSSFRPLIFHAKTDSNGIAIVHLQLPQFRAGRGAILVRAIHSGEEAELRQVIRQS